MPSQLRILILEDQPMYIDILSLRLLEDNVEAKITLVGTRDAYLKALNSSKFDAIISDYVLPDTNGKEALALAKQICPATPFIIFTGSVDEETAVECMKNGAADYVLKQQPTRLAPALLSAVANSQKEKALRETEQKYRAIFENCIEGIYQSTPEGRYLTVNPALARIYGYNSPEEMIRSVNDIASQVYVDPERRQEFKKVLEKSGRITGFEYEAFRKNSEKIWISANAVAVKDENGRTLFYEGFAEDITERKRAEEERTALALRNEALVQALAEIVYDWRPLEDSLIWEGDFTRILGYTSSEMGSNTESWTSRVHPDDLQHVLEEVKMAAQQRRLYDLEYRFRRKDRTYVWMHDRGVTYVDERGTLIRIIGVFRDITERAKAKEELKESELKYRNLIDQAWDAIIVADRTGKMLLVNEQACRLLGYTQEELLQLNVADTYPVEERAIAAQRIAAVQRRGHLRYERDMVRKNGTIFPVEVAIGVRPNGLIQGIVRDITERRRAQEEIQNLAKFPSENPNPVLRIARDGTLLYINQAGLSLLADWHLQVGKPVTPILREVVFKSMNNGTAQMLELEYAERVYSFHVAPVVALRYANLYGRDITEYKRAEKELGRSATQLRALAAHLQSIREEERTFVAREIHDQLGQALTALKIDLSLIEDLLVGKVTPSKLSAISDKVRTMSALTAETVQTVRKISAHLRPVILDSLGLSAAIDWEVEEFQKRTGIQCKCSLPEDEVKLDRDHSTTLFRILQEALNNITRHAKATTVNVKLANDTGAVVMKVQDNGVGIPEERLSASDSFGILGMRERALIFGGTVKVSGVPKKGTTVTASIPLT